MLTRTDSFAPHNDLRQLAPRRAVWAGEQRDEIKSGTR